MGYATVYKLNVRSGPGLNHEIKGRIYRGQPVLLLGRNSAATWLKVEAISGIEGWVYARYIRSNIPITELLILHEPPTPPPANPTGYVTVYGLNVRSGPGLNYGIMGQAYKDKPITLLGRNVASTWLQMKTRSGLEGWASAYYIYTNFPITDLPVLQEPPTPSPNPIGFVTIYTLNVRSGPSMDYGIKGWLYRGQPVTLLGRNNTATWLKVEEARTGFDGWVFANYIRSNVPITDLPVVQ